LKKKHLVHQVGGYAKGQLPIHGKHCKIKTLNEGMELDGLMDADVSEYKGIRVINYTGCNRRNGPDFGRVFLMLNYNEKPQNTYIQS
jgi:hypothetical protein